MDYIEDDFTDALIDAICEKSPSTWYTLIGENFDPDGETIVKEADNKKDIEDAFEAEVAKLETAFARGAFKFLYTVAPFIVK